jgi:hypothetical protein
MTLHFNHRKSTEFHALIDNLVSAVFYHQLTIQKVIHIIQAQHKDMLANAVKENVHLSIDTDTEVDNSSTLPLLTYNNSTHDNKQKCYASKCHLLQERGILQHSSYCTNGCSM